MRRPRQNLILDIISKYEVDTQERLSELLRENGHDVTQATISRDIKDLQLLKTLTAMGRYKYAVSSSPNPLSLDRSTKIFRETVLSVASSGNIIVIKTLPGCANAAAEIIDSMSFPEIMGSIAGDNTIFLVVDDPENLTALVSRFQGLLR